MLRALNPSHNPAPMISHVRSWTFANMTIPKNLQIHHVPIVLCVDYYLVLPRFSSYQLRFASIILIWCFFSSRHSRRRLSMSTKYALIFALTLPHVEGELISTNCTAHLIRPMFELCTVALSAYLCGSVYLEMRIMCIWRAAESKRTNTMATKFTDT